MYIDIYRYISFSSLTRSANPVPFTEKQFKFYDIF